MVIVMSEINILKERTNYNEEQCKIILEIVMSHKVIGRNNKEKVISDFRDKLHVSYEEGNNLYNICSELILKKLISFKRLF